MRRVLPRGTQQRVLTDQQHAFIAGNDPVEESEAQDDVLMSMPLTEAKRRVAAAFERSYLVHVMERAGGSVSKGAVLSGIERSNFRRLLQRHGLRMAQRRDG